MSRQCWETPERRVDRIVGVFACRRVATGGLAVDAFADLGLASQANACRAFGTGDVSRLPVWGLRPVLLPVVPAALVTRHGCLTWDLRPRLMRVVRSALVTFQDCPNWYTAFVASLH